MEVGIVRDIVNNTIAALFSLSFDLKKKYSYPALEITYFAIDKNYRGQGLGRELIEVIVERAKTQDVAACLFLTVNALHTKEYSAVGFYEKCKFAKLSPVPQMDVWPMYKTIWVK